MVVQTLFAAVRTRTARWQRARGLVEGPRSGGVSASDLGPKIMKVAFVTFPHSGHFNPMSALAPINHKFNCLTYAVNVMLLRALLSIFDIARFLGFEGSFPNYCDFSAMEPISSLFRDKALAL